MFLNGLPPHKAEQAVHCRPSREYHLDRLHSEGCSWLFLVALAGSSQVLINLPILITVVGCKQQTGLNILSLLVRFPSLFIPLIYMF